MFEKKKGKIKFKVKNDNIDQVLTKYENNWLCASILGRHLLSYNQISVLVGRHLFGHNQICVLVVRHSTSHGSHKGDFFEKFLTLLEA